MIETTQVQEIYQIDGIENLLDYEFSFVFYDFVSNIKTYEYRTQNKIIEVNMICNERICFYQSFHSREHTIFYVNEYEYEVSEDN